jgi:hypothetical protein
MADFETVAIIQVYPLWQRGQLLLDCAPIQINCNSANMGTLRAAWLVPKSCKSMGGGKDYFLVFTLPDPSIGGVMQGVWMRTNDGGGILLNVGTVLDVVSACNDCCNDSTTVLPPAYTPGDPIAPVQDYLPSTYYFDRVDNGNYLSYLTAEMDYYGQYLIGTFKKNDRVGDVTTYQFDSMNMPTLVGADTYGPGTYKKMSNEAPVKDVDALYTLMVTSTEFGNSGPWYGKTLAEIVYQLQTVEMMVGDIGVSVQQNRIIALTVDNTLTFTLGATGGDGPPMNVFISNAIGSVGAGQHINLFVSENVDPLYSPASAASIAALVTSLNSFAPFNGMGTWSAYGTSQIQLVTADYSSLTLQLEVNNIFFSNQAPALTVGNQYRLTGYVNNAVLSPVIMGATLAEIVTGIGLSTAWTTIGGSWSVNGNQQITLTGGTATNVYLVIDQVVAVTVLSNAAPGLPAGQHYTAVLTIPGGVQTLPYMSSGTVTGLVNFLNTTAPYSSYGTWSVSGGNRVQAANPRFSPFTVVINAVDVFYSNPAPTLTAGQSLQLRLWNSGNGGFIQPYVIGASIAEILAAIPTTNTWATARQNGTWGTINNEVTLTGSTQKEIYMILEAITTPAPVVSNAAPVLPGGQHYLLIVSGTGVSINAPFMASATVAGLVGFLSTTAPYNTMGAWSVSGGDKVQLANPHLSGLVLQIVASNQFTSNEADPQGAQTLRLRLWRNTAFITPDVTGPTLLDVLTNIPNTGDWATARDGGSFGTAGQAISLQGSTETEIYMLLLVEGTAFLAFTPDSESADVSDDISAKSVSAFTENKADSTKYSEEKANTTKHSDQKKSTEKAKKDKNK